MSENADKLSEAEVRTIAHLARLAPSDAEVESLRTELSDMLAMAATLADADLEGADPMTSPVEAINRLRDDEPTPTLTPGEVEHLAPDTAADGSIRVPRVLGDSAGA
ncbi:MAG: Asp-tRNA(Asn)/Glu-tRNA(Gln) amidotransferase subunit GatC [Phycisphaerales bacterium]|nr:Asp-tRNA(Asn)/Glu-tRNA(Gln) amidotransferase subunit GatC [Phycisphaerales bacterium]MCB9835825.1 Asp-tRNA(Asn)/Glu-tRNA(Gln) amidotransferase subunit GatC [Phycisphaera sp.]